MTTEPFVRLVSPGITGVEGPKANGDCRGSYGQCRDALNRIEHSGPDYATDWTPEMAVQLRDVWNRWHLNDMRAGTPAQEEWKRLNRFPGYLTDHYTWVKGELAAAGLDPDDSEPARDGTNTGYRYGSAWLHEDVPDDVLRWLHDLPETDRVYPWSRSVAR